MSYCSECTYLNLNSCDDYGRFWCEKKLERHSATELECDRFCRAYSRSSSEANSAYNYSKDHSSSGGCYLTTVMCDILKMPDKNYYLNTLRVWRDNTLHNDEAYKPLLVEYDVVGPKLAEHLKDDPIKYQIAATTFFSYIKPICGLIKENKNAEAVQKYVDMTNKFKLIYNIDNSIINQKLIENADIEKSGHGKYIVKKLTY